MCTRWVVVILSTDLERRLELARILTANEIDYDCASSIEDCKEIVARESVGIVFWDGHLADGACGNLLYSIWSLDRRVKIVLMSQVDSSEKHQAMAQMGVFGVVPLPCQPTDIEWILSRAVRADREEERCRQPGMQHLHP